MTLQRTQLLGHKEPQTIMIARIAKVIGYSFPEIDTSTLGGQFKRLRVERGISVQRMIRIARMDRQTILRIEANSANSTCNTIERVKAILANPSILDEAILR